MATEALEKTVPASGEEIFDLSDVGKQLPDEVHVDTGWALYKEALALDPIERDAIAKRVKRKCDWILLPLMCFIYFLSFLDKQTLNYANAYGLKSDLHLVGQQYSNIASITNAGNAIFAYPMVFALHKFPIGKFLACALLTWGTLLMCTMVVQNLAGIMILRFLLGGAESCIAPAWMMLTGMFWTRQEQPFRMC